MAISEMELVFPEAGFGELNFTDWPVEPPLATDLRLPLDIDLGFDAANRPDASEVANWFEQETIENIPTTHVPFMFAQGWTVPDDAPPVADGNSPPQYIWTLTRNTFKAEPALTNLLTNYTKHFNDARAATDRQYDDVVMLWSDTLLKTQSHLNRAAAGHNAYEVTLITTLSDIVSQIQTRAYTMLAGAGATFDEVVDALNTYVNELSRLGTGYDTYSAAMETILTTQSTSLSQFVSRAAALLTQLGSDYTTHDAAIADLESTEDSNLTSHVTAYEAKLDAMETAVSTVETQLLGLVDDAEAAYTEYRTEALSILTEMDTALSALSSGIDTQLDAMDAAIAGHEVTYDGLLALLTTDYDTHAGLTRGYLSDLGTTELARINELFDNLLASARQNLTDRGFYSSALVTQTDARVERERSEAITTLNDRLNREKVDHEHKLYAELTSVRDKSLAGEQYVHSLDDAAIKYRAEWTLRLHQQTVEFKKTVLDMRDNLRQAKNQFIAQEQGVRTSVFGWGQDARKAVADGKDQVYQLRQAVIRWKSDSEFKLAAELRSIRDATGDLYKTELDARNGADAFAAGIREKILTLLNGYIAQYASGLNTYAQTNLANGQFLANVRENVIADIMKARFQYTTGLTQAQAKQHELHKFQLDSRNNLATALFRFMGDRKWEKPELQEFAQMVLTVGQGADALAID